MSDISFIFYSLKSRWLNSFLSVLLTVFGVSLAVVISQFTNHIQNRLNEAEKKIDIVVGAKGSPLQLVLSSVYHVDIPTGNIPYNSLEKIKKNPMIDKVIPLALGDNWQGFRIVGTTREYIEHYSAQINKGNFWKNDFETLIGSGVELKLNDQFIGSHGLIEGGDSHEHKKYRVVGILKSTGTVLDRLILTSLNSVLEIHGHEKIEYKNNEYQEHNEPDKHHKHEEHNKHSEHDGHHEHKEKNDDQIIENQLEKNYLEDKLVKPEITALLVTTKSPIANINLPRKINKETSLQAANPAFEITRLKSMLGLGSKSFTGLSVILIIIAVLSIFSGLASNLENRMSDLAILRALGYSKFRIFKIITLEAMMIVISGLIIGLLLGFFSFMTLIELLTPVKTGVANISFTVDLIFIIFSVLFAGFIAGILPAYRGSRISVVNQLSRTI